MENKVYDSDVLVERRKFPRKPLNISLEFQLAEEEMAPPTPEASQNLSASGLGLAAEVRLKKGQELLLTLFIPPREKRSAEKMFIIVPKADCWQVKIRAQVIWGLPFIANKHMYGIQFLEINPNDRPVYDEFLKDFYIHKPNLIGEKDSSESESF